MDHNYTSEPHFTFTDMEQGLYRIFADHPRSSANDDGQPSIPADCLVDVLHSFHEEFGVELMTAEEQAMLDQLLALNPGLEVIPAMVLKFFSDKTAASPSPPESPGHDDCVLQDDRGRSDDRDYVNSRSSSVDSNDAYYHGSASRPPSRGPPQTPSSSKSFLDSEKRQRSTPLAAAPPSSWSKRPPHHRRKSDAGNRSDNEGGPPSAFNRSVRGRGIASNPVSPSASSLDLGGFSPATSHGPRSRPPSRANSQSGLFGHSSQFLDDHDFLSNDDMTIQQRRRLSFGSSGGLNTVPLPRGNPTDFDSDEEEDVRRMVTPGRPFRTESDASMDELAIIEALQRANEELTKKKQEAEDALHRKIAEAEQEYADLSMALEQVRTELSATKREEKELRSKERQCMQQITALEAEIVKINNQLSSTKATYQALQKSYQDQCTISENYRNDLRDRELQLRSTTETLKLTELEKDKLEIERIKYEERINQLDAEVANAQSAFASLEEQKHENLLLKETIDRLRFEIDELRNASTSGVTDGQASAAASISRSLGAELAGKLKFGEDEQTDNESTTETIVEEEEVVTEGEEDDVIQTIITRRKRKVPSRAAHEVYLRREFEEAKEYSDMGIQYDPTLFSVSRSQQTEPPPKILKASFSIQTDDPEPVVIIRSPSPKPTCEMEIQTEAPEPEEEPSRSPSPQHLESMASSSSTVVPATPKALPRLLDIDPLSLPLDQPPAYNQIHDHTTSHNWSLVADVLKKWHQGVKIPAEAIPGGVSEETVEEWKALQQELGVGCTVIDRLIENSERTPGRSHSRSNSVRGKGRASPSSSASPHGRNRFYNIYNTYVYPGDKNSLFGSLLGQAALVAGAGALVMLAVSPYVAPQYTIPGGATYYDRAAWNSFNSIGAAGEGFSGVDGADVVWSFLGRVGGGAARMVRGWPT